MKICPLCKEPITYGEFTLTLGIMKQHDISHNEESWHLICYNSKLAKEVAR